jgi:transposase
VEELMMSDNENAGFTVPEVARRFRVGAEKVRNWIRTGQLKAINTVDSQIGAKRWVIPPEALEEFEASRAFKPTVDIDQIHRRLWFSAIR